MDPSKTQLTEVDRQHVQINEQFTRTDSTFDGETEKKEELSKGSDTSTNEKAELAPQDPGDRPTGLKLVFILIALILSVFLFSLDQVSSHQFKFSCSHVQ
jgi:hypothetical protein